MASKSKARRKVFAASCILAALIVAGSSFAWFTSKDEVVNRLSANANYGVAIAEDFAPPENWVPGQTIEKNVSVTNTGNVDAFVRSWMQGEMRVVKEDSAGTDLTNAVGAVDATDKKYIDLGFTKYNATASKYLKTLSKDPVANPSDSANSSNNTTNTTAYSEVMAAQAGGFLAYAPSNAEYKYTTNQETVVDNYYEDASTLRSVTLPIDTEVEVVATAAAGKVKAQDTSSANFKGVDIDSDTFLPKSTGLYLFRRVVDVDSTTDKYEYSGYYYVEGSGYGDGTYYALQTGKHGVSDTNVSEYTVPTSQVTTAFDAQSGLVDYITPSCKLYTVTETKVENSSLTWVYVATTGGKATMTATYNNGTSSDSTDDIAVEVALVNVGAKTTGLNKNDNTGTNETWTAMGSAGLTTFYYNNDLESGDTTSRLIDSVKLADATDKKAYVAFDFDLNVFMESAQVTVDETGKEHTNAVNTWAATEVSSAAVNTGAKPSGANDAATYDTTDTNEINVVGWVSLS